MKVEFGNSFASVEFSPAVFSILRKEMYWQPEGYFFSEAYRKGKWDGKYYLVTRSKEKLIFPTGLLSIAIAALRKAGVEAELKDCRDPSFERKELIWKGKDLRDYQIEARQAAVKSTRGIWGNATGSGKMLLAASLIQQIGGRATIAVLTKEALKDTARELEESIDGCEIGMWGAGKKKVGWVTVTTHKSFAQYKDDNELQEHIKNSSVLIFDEVHYAAADSYYNAMMNCNAYYKIGMSGTPFRGDRKDLKIMAATGRKIYELPTVELQKKGFAVKAEIRFLKSPRPDHIDGLLLSRLDSRAIYEEGIVRNRERDSLAIELAKKHAREGKIILITVERAEHGKALSEATGWPYVDGSTRAGEREEIQRQFAEGEIPVLIASRIYNQSANFPRLSVLINLAGFSPKAALIQKLGRIVRTAEGKDEAIMYDFYDGWEKRLLKHSLKRMAHLREEGHEVFL